MDNSYQSIGDLFSSSALYNLFGSPPSGFPSLNLSVTTPVGFGFNPPDNGSLQWLNPAASKPEWAEVLTTTSIPVADNVQLRFIPTAEASQLASDSQPLTVAVASGAPIAIGDPPGFTGPGFTGSVDLQIPNAAAYSYATGQAIGLNAVNADIGGNLMVQVPVRAGISVSSAGVTDNAVALLDATNIGGVLGVNPAINANDTTLKSAANLQVLADVSGLVSASAHTSADIVNAYADADAHTRFGIKSPPGATSPANNAQGGFGILNMDLVAGADANVRGTTAIQLDTSSDSTSGRARATTDVADVAGVGDSAVQAAADLNLSGIAGIGLHTAADSKMGSAEAFTSLENLRGIFSDTTTSGTAPNATTTLNNPGATVGSKVLDPYSAGGNLAINTGAKLTALTEASVVGDGVKDHFEGAAEFLKGDEATAIADLGRAYGLVSDAKGGLQMEASGRVDLNINSQANFTTMADAVAGHASAKSELLSNNGAVNANLFAGDTGSINSNVDTIFKTIANTIVGDTTAKGTAMNTVGIGASEFTFTGLGGLVNADANTNGLVRAVSTLGRASSELNSSTGGIVANTGETWNTINSPALVPFQAKMSGAEQINAIANNTGFAQAAAVAGSSGHNGVSATANQASIGVDGYHFSTSESLNLSSVNNVDSTAQAVFGTTSL